MINRGKMHFRNVAEVHRRLVRGYPPTDLGNKVRPFDELVFLILSTQTREKYYKQAFNRVESLVANWNELKDIDEAELMEAIGSAGLNAKKARYLRSAARHISERRGRVSLDYLHDLSTPEAEKELLELPGVGLKVAKCVLLYALGRFVFPVDIHCARVAIRLGWVNKDQAKSLSSKEAREYEASIPPVLRGALHVKFVQHGRQICTAKDPQCGGCTLAEVCQYANSS